MGINKTIKKKQKNEKTFINYGRHIGDGITSI